MSYLLMLTSTLLCQAAILRQQGCHGIHDIKLHARRRSFWVAWARATNKLGRGLAVLNALWVLDWSFLALSNVMHQAAGVTAWFGLKEHGWARLWLLDVDQFKNTRRRQLCLLMVALFTSYGATMFLFVYARIQARESSESIRRTRVRFLVGVGIVTAMYITLVISLSVLAFRNTYQSS